MLVSLGAQKWRVGYWVAEGGVSAVIFNDPSTVDKKTWKNVNRSKNEWMPRLNTPEGKEMDKKLSALPKVSIKELNACIGFQEQMFKTIGLYMGNKQYFGITAEDDWGIKPPPDCKEVTVTEYNSLFKEKKQRT